MITAGSVLRCLRCRVVQYLSTVLLSHFYISTIFFHIPLICVHLKYSINLLTWNIYFGLAWHSVTLLADRYKQADLFFSYFSWVVSIFVKGTSRTTNFSSLAYSLLADNYSFHQYGYLYRRNHLWPREVRISSNQICCGKVSIILLYEWLISYS